MCAISGCHHEYKYRGFTIRCKPLVTLRNKNIKVEFARKLKEPVQFWGKSLWTDEIQINLKGRGNYGEGEKHLLI